MFANATAARAASFGIRDLGYSPCSVSQLPPENDLVLETPRPQLSDTKPENLIQAPSRISSQWLAAVQERVQNSIVPKDCESENDGRWLTEDIATSASAFFEMASDVLPNEPYIYSSQDGDLVAEFGATHGTMTGIIAKNHVVLFAVVDGVPIESRLVLGSDDSRPLRRELQHLTEMLHTGRHGAVETA
jgi:hypothetical protein